MMYIFNFKTAVCSVIACALAIVICRMLGFWFANLVNIARDDQYLVDFVLRVDETDELEDLLTYFDKFRRSLFIDDLCYSGAYAVSAILAAVLAVMAIPEVLIGSLIRIPGLLIAASAVGSFIVGLDWRHLEISIDVEPVVDRFASEGEDKVTLVVATSGDSREDVIVTRKHADAQSVIYVLGQSGLLLAVSPVKFSPEELTGDDLYDE